MLRRAPEAGSRTSRPLLVGTAGLGLARLGAGWRGMMCAFGLSAHRVAQSLKAP